MNKETRWKEIVLIFKNMLLGNADVSDILDSSIKEIDSIRNYMFNRKLQVVMNELKANGTIQRKVGNLLAKSNYGEEYGYALLHYIDEYEHVDKGRIMAFLLDATSKKFIIPNECFQFCKILDDVSLNSLCFLKQNIMKRVLYNIEIKDMLYVNELLTYSLMYRSEKMDTHSV